MALGPVQLLVVGYGKDANFTGGALKELHRLSEHDIVHLVDLLVVAKDQDGNVTQVELADLPELQEYGAIAGALLGFGAAGEAGAEAGAIAGAEATADGRVYDPEDVWLLAEQIPPGMTAAIAMLEHRWAIPMRDAITDAGGVVLADEWVHPEDSYVTAPKRLRSDKTRGLPSLVKADAEKGRGAFGAPPFLFWLTREKVAVRKNP